MNQREIKFRAWDCAEEEMFEVKNLQLWLLSTPTRYEDGSGRPKGKFELMQYTGLKDRHGKEIFEGDVVEWTTRDIETGIETIDRAEIREEIVGNFKSYGIGLIVNPTVVGNIYEHPHLLESHPQGN